MILTEYDYDTDIAVQREEAYEEGLNKGITQGVEQSRIETAKKMLEFGDTKEKISTITGLSLEQVEQLANELAK